MTLSLAFSTAMSEMVVSVKPVGRNEYKLTLDGPPRYSSSIAMGYEQAEIDCRLSEDEREYVRGGTLRIHGTTGIIWQGIVVQRPDATGTTPLIAQGWGWALTFNRRSAAYLDTDLTAWQARTAFTCSQNWQFSADTDSLHLAAAASGTSGAFTGAFRRVSPQVVAGETATLAFDWARSHTSLRLSLFTGNSPSADSSTAGYEVTGGWTQVWSSSGDYTSTSSSVSVSQSGTFDSWLIHLSCSASYDSGYYANFTEVKYYGVNGVSLATTHNIVDDVLTNDLDTDYLPAGLWSSYIATQATELNVKFDACDGLTKIQELSKYVPYDLIWYTERASGYGYIPMPHWVYRSSTSTPYYYLKLSECESFRMDESGLDELYSAVRVRYTDASGKSRTKELLDTDTTHPLVAAGIVRWGDLEVPTTASATASALGEYWLLENGKPSIKGTVTTRIIHLQSGVDAYMPRVVPGRMVRLFEVDSGGYVDCLIKRVRCTGEVYGEIELDNEPYRLDLLLARLSIGLKA